MPDLAELNLVINSGQVNTATTSLNTLTSASQKLELQVNVTAKAFDTLNNGAKNNKSVLDVLTNSYGSLLGTLGTVTGGLVSLAVAYKALMLGGRENELTIQFTYLLGSVDKATKAIQTLHDIADTDGQFTLPGLATAYKQLVQFGVAADDIPNALKAITNTAAVSGQGDSGLTQITTTLGRLLDTGQLAGRQLVQMQREGVPALAAINKAYGSLYEAQKAGVTGQQLVNVTIAEMATDYEGAAAKIGSTSNNIWGTITNIVEDYGAKIGQVLQKAFTFGASSDTVANLKSIGEFALQTVEALTGIELPAHKASGAVQELAKWLKIIGASLITAALVQGFLALNASIELVSGSMAVLNAIMEANPFGLLAVAAGVAVGYLVSISDHTLQIGDDTVTVGDVIVSTFQVVAQRVKQFFVDLTKDIQFLVEQWVPPSVLNVLDTVHAIGSGVADALTQLATTGNYDQGVRTPNKNGGNNLGSGGGWEGFKSDIATGAVNRARERNSLQSLLGSGSSPTGQPLGGGGGDTTKIDTARKALDAMNEKLDEQIATFNLSSTAAKNYAEIIKATDEANIEFGKGTDQANKAVADLTAKLNQLDVLKTFKEIGNDVGNAFGSAIDVAISKTNNLKAAMQDLFNSITKSLEKTLITNPISDLVSGGVSSLLGAASGNGTAGGGNAGIGSAAFGIGSALFGGLGRLFGFGGGSSFTPTSTQISTAYDPGELISQSAKGNVFNRGYLQPFAYGGVVSSPTFFPMAGGNSGLMGEAGPEGILPLTRGRDGKLGVSSNGAGDNSVTNHNYAITQNISTPDANSFRQSQRVLADQAVDSIRRASR